MLDLDWRPTIRHAWIELTQQCNLECMHCYNESGPNRRADAPLSRSEYEDLIRSLREAGCASLQFIGGEPTLYRDLPALISFARTVGVSQIEVFSNLLHLSSNLLECLKANSAELACSFYADDPSIHDLITGRPGSYERTVANIERVVELGIPLRAGLIILPGRNDRTIDRTIAFLKSIGVTSLALDHARAFGRGARGNETEEEQFRALCGNCANESVCVDPEGIAFPCIMSRRWPLGSIRQREIALLIRSPEWQSFSDRLKKQAAVNGSCNPGDKCSPGACSPQVGGPPSCQPHINCAPQNFPCNPCNPSS